MGRPTDPNFWQQSPPPQTGDMNNERTLNQRFMRELPGALPPQDVIIHDGAISGFESAALIVDTEGEAAADELNVINIVLSANENLHPGMIITLRAKDQARTVTVKNSAAANGINTAGGHDVVLSTEWDLVLRLVAGRWYEIQTRGDVRASDAQTDASTALARTAPATTTSRGIGRVATLADMEPGAVVENGPAVIDAKGGVITTTPTAHAVPQADGDGKIDPRWCGTASRIFASFNTSEPDGLLCNGGAVSRTTYADLFAVIGTSFGAGDGSTTFNLPDLRNRTLWGASSNLKSILGATLPALTGTIRIKQHVANGWDANTDAGTGCLSPIGADSRGYTASGGGYASGTTGIKIDGAGSNPIYGAGSTVRTPSIAVNFFIKY